MKRTLTKKLLGYFFLTLIVFIALSSFIVFQLGQRQFLSAYRDTMGKRAQDIAHVIEENPDLFSENTESSGETTPHERRPQGQGMRQEHGSGEGMGRPGMGYNRRPLDLVSSLFSEDVLLYDFQSSTFSKEHQPLASLPEIPKILENIQGGSLLELHVVEGAESDIVVATAPIHTAGNVTSAVFLSESVSTFNAFIQEAFRYYAIAAIAALLLAGLLALLFARSFVKPIDETRAMADRLAKGDYNVRSTIRQKNELGALGDDMNTLAKELEASKKEREQREQVRRNIITNISHELKTPMTVFKTSLEALMDGVVDDPKEFQEYHQVLYDETKLMEALIGDLGGLTKLQKEEVQVAKSEINLVQPIKEAIASQIPLAKEKSIEIMTTLPSSIPFYGDDMRLKQLFAILINNGIKYSPTGEKIIIEVINKDALSIHIKNTGVALPQSEYDRIFVQFYRGTDALRASVPGSGIGLSLAKEIAEQHGGNIHVTSDENPLSTSFQIIFPKGYTFSSL